MEKPKYGERWDLLMILNIQTHGGGCAMVWTCMAAFGTGLIIFIDVTHDGSTRMKSNIYRNVLSANIWRNASKLKWEELHYAARPFSKTHCHLNEGLNQILT